MDPSMFISSQPQYIMPDGGTGSSGKGKFEFALGHIGWAVGCGFAVGSIRGGLGELMNPDTRKLVGKPWMTRMVNATVKHGSGYAQPAGAVVFMYSALEIALRSVRAEDELNSLGAGALTGAIYRSPHGLRASGIGFWSSRLKRAPINWETSEDWEGSLGHAVDDLLIGNQRILLNFVWL
ncbi:hypothetical protein TELCIR_08062 [Teladorsagia circumcincta]|uniref:Uncharacterized protein n=1 Tax=Teladorsagia circumcincta TaxID=45464 RepID=A0A2G9UKT7_TELCI|nr:hypothetical protein TELCIR_08062 [Teladorsagia circumcincta]